MSRQLRIPKGVTVVGGDLVDAARKVGHSEGRLVGLKEGYLEGYRAALALVERLGEGKERIAPYFLENHMTQDLGRWKERNLSNE